MKKWTTDPSKRTWYVEYDFNEDGKPMWFRSGFKTEAEAKAFAETVNGRYGAEDPIIFI